MYDFDVKITKKTQLIVALHKMTLYIIFNNQFKKTIRKETYSAI